MSAEEMKAKIRRVFDEAYNKGNVDVLDELFAADFVLHMSLYPDIKGLEVLKQHIADLRSSYSDIQFTIGEIIIEGNRSAMRFTFRGTHKEQGKQVIVPECLVWHLVKGKIVEEWAYADQLGFLQQIGVVPPIGQSKE